MLARGFIHLFKSLFGSLILFIKKADGSLHLVVDYWKLNEITIRKWYPLPIILEFHDRIKDVKYYTIFDLHNAFD